MVKDDDARSTGGLLDVLDDIRVVFLLDVLVVQESFVLCGSANECEAILVQGERLLAAPHILDLNFVRRGTKVGLSYTILVCVCKRLRTIRRQVGVIDVSGDEVAESHWGAKLCEREKESIVIRRQLLQSEYLYIRSTCMG